MIADSLPFTWRWSITVPQALTRASQDVLAEILRALRAEGAIATTRDATTVDFRCPGITGMSRWALLAPISSGYVTIDSSPGAVRLVYALRFTLTFWFSLMATVVFWILSHPRRTSLEVFYPFLFLYGGNVASSLWRFPRFLRRALASPSAI
jgi:hypothetical protein